MKQSKNNMKIYVAVGSAVLCMLLFALALAVGNARAKTDKYIDSAQQMARQDLADAAMMLENAVKSGDRDSANRAAGLAEAYLSRAGLDDCSALYAILSGIPRGEYGIEACEEFALAARKARDGDGGTALRRLARLAEYEPEALPAETTEDALSARVLKRMGRSADDVAEKKARAFCCPNAAFEKCETDIPNSYKFSGDNIFIALEGERPHVTMYCFERDTVEDHTVTSEDAAEAAQRIIKKENLRLSDTPNPTREDGIYRFTYTSEEGEALVVMEFYSDTGRLRKYDAVNYYSKTK